MKIIADSAIPFLEGVLEPFAEVRYLPGKSITAADVRDADALIIRTRTRCDASLLEAGTNTLTLTVPEGPVNNGIIYDYIRLELDESGK